ncbi:hypothetical protein FACS1894159_09700 [Bacteroidia bacterium]|nr:hypothetical protein FACS1894159_09700 [Bacteroidia bacterium]
MSKDTVIDRNREALREAARQLEQPETIRVIDFEPEPESLPEVLAPWDEPLQPPATKAVGKSRPGISEPGAAESATAATSAAGEADEPDENEEDDFARREPPSKFKQYLWGVLSGSILNREEVRKTYKYLIAIALLMMFYIYNVFDMQQLYRRREKLTVQVRELRAQSMALSAMRMDATRQSAVVRELRARGSQVGESLIPPKVVEK